MPERTVKHVLSIKTPSAAHCMLKAFCQFCAGDCLACFCDHPVFRLGCRVQACAWFSNMSEATTVEAL